MDDRLKKALDFANYRITLFNTKENIKLKVDSMLTHATNGGMFKVTIELINFTKLLLDMEQDAVVLIDVNGNPIEIDDIQQFHSSLLNKYFQATNYYYTEWTKIKGVRAVKDIFPDIIGDFNK
jgi:hypothetical protein